MVGGGGGGGEMGKKEGLEELRTEDLSGVQEVRN